MAAGDATIDEGVDRRARRSRVRGLSFVRNPFDLDNAHAVDVARRRAQGLAGSLRMYSYAKSGATNPQCTRAHAPRVCHRSGTTGKLQTVSGAALRKRHSSACIQ